MLMRHSDAEALAPMRAGVFGSFQLFAPDGTEIVFSGKRTQALLTMLCLQPGVAIERDQLSHLLWRGKYRAHARASLRQTLLALKKQLAPICDDFLQVSRERVAVSASAVQSDLAQLERALGEGRADAASELLIAIAAKPLIDQFELGEPFSHWLAAQRAQIEQRLQRAVEQALAACRRSGDTQAEDRLRAAWRLRDPNVSSADTDVRLRIAVLPFRVPEADERLCTIAQGLFDELVATLGQAPQLLVAGRASSLHAAKLNRPLPQLAQTLHVAYLLEGAIQRHGDALRVHVGLIDGASGFELWSQSYSGASDDLFALQTRIAGELTRELGSALKRKVRPPSGRRTTASKAAYDLYLQGRALTFRAIGDGVLARAVELLEASLDIDPEFPACWTALAEAYAYTAVYTPCLDRVAKSQRMAECALKAIELDPQQGHARAMLGIHRWTENDPVGALDLAHEAYRLEPDNADVVLRLGSFLLYIGRSREALPYIETAVDLDPFNGRNFAMLSVAHLNLGDIGKAIAAGHRMVDLGMPSMWLGVATAASGNHKFAVEQYWQTRLLMNTVIFPPAGTKPLSGSTLDAYWRVAAKGICSGRAVHRTVYCTMLDFLHATLPDPCDTSIVAPAVWMGYARMVFKTLGTQITPANMFCLMSLWADVDPIRRTRQHAGFMAFAERIGLRAAWDKYGWPDLLPRPKET